MLSETLTSTLKGLVDDLSELMRQEFALAKAETSEKFEQLQSGLIAIGVGLLIAFCALLVLIEALVVALANVMPASLASLLVGLVLAVIAYVAVRKGQENLAARNLMPRRTLRSVQAQAERLKEKVQ